jgi:ATP-binding cassette subfamily A (ABC1) protein 3
MSLLLIPSLVLWALLVPTSSLAIVIFWQILTGWAVTGASVFAAAFFTRSNVAGIVVPGLSFILAALASVVENQVPRIPFGEILGLGFFFPSMNYVFFFDFLVNSEMAGTPVNLASLISTTNAQAGTFTKEQLAGWVFHNSPAPLWGFLAIQIIAYPLLAVLVEHMLHGTNRRRRDFTSTTEADSSHVAIETVDLEKHYRPSIWARIFCCARKPTVKAVNSLSLVSQKRQILCLLGPNGSGKTTTLDMIAGFQSPTAGSININASASQLGVCPQKNVLFKNLTVYEHLVFWNTIKSGTDSPESLQALIETCDLTNKKHSLASRLSGGMKRKLQLACMLVGGSSVCLLDEVTSGLDPISRRVIWNAILGERSRRTMIFTTHFLDECEVLSDHIVILSLGKMKCQGTPAELKNQFGGGYRVHLPKTEDISNIKYPVTDHGDRYICTTPDSTSAARFLSTLQDSKGSEHFITGPTIEDVFLKVSEEPHALDEEIPDHDIAPSKPENGKADEAEITPTRRAIFSRQAKALFWKRVIMLRTQWWTYLFALAVPIVCSHFIGPFLKDYKPPNCNDLLGDATFPFNVHMFGLSELLVGPRSENTSIVDAVKTSFIGVEFGGYFAQSSAPILQDTRDNFMQYVVDHNANLFQGGLYIDNVTAPLIAIPARIGTLNTVLSLLNIANIARTGVPVQVSYGFLRSNKGYGLSFTVIWTGIFCLLQAIYPAFFCLYPAYERRSQVRALQYSNGVRALPLWLAYMLFDFIFVLLISTICIVLIMNQAPFWGLGYVWFVLVLYGVAAMLVSYMVSAFSRSQPAAFAWVMLINIVEFILSIIALIVSLIHCLSLRPLDKIC